ncbi:MAG TPA: apolipoprotein N-acyltransferase [Pyrinomonadaceae bacterium]|nr:apolipoprotein N-acyltransferase [Pyrinomonadaceae bacterium]
MQLAVSRTEWAAAGASTLLLIFSFPNFEFYFLAWVALVPLLVAVVRRPSPARAFILGWATGSVFFYTTCYWLTYSMIHYGGLPPVLAYLLLIPGALVVGVFHGIFTLLVALVIQRWGHISVLLAPVFWTALELIRLSVTGQLWNAIGYSQAYHPRLIQAATWGGVYAVSFLIVTINSAITLLIVNHTQRAIIGGSLVALFVAIVIVVSPMREHGLYEPDRLPVSVVAVQPNVPMTIVKSDEETNELLERHLSLSRQGLQQTPVNTPSLVVWPESPMNFTYASNKPFQELVAKFTRENHTSLLFNSLEPGPGGGAYNSALLINEEGRLISQYDKIRLMPFGEYVPLPQWLPGASLITGIVGDFTPGTKYTLMPIGGRRVGVFICIESAYPWIARTFVNEGADGLINISNDGYLGPTAVMRQHLANVVFRAVENSTPILRVTNTGLSAQISYDGTILDSTKGFQPDVRHWYLRETKTGRTFYTKYGDLFVYLCTAVTFAIVILINLYFIRGIRGKKI